jgi:hypothetical protein
MQVGYMQGACGACVGMRGACGACVGTHAACTQGYASCGAGRGCAGSCGASAAAREPAGPANKTAGVDGQQGCWPSLPVISRAGRYQAGPAGQAAGRVGVMRGGRQVFEFRAAGRWVATHKLQVRTRPARACSVRPRRDEPGAARGTEHPDNAACAHKRVPAAGTRRRRGTRRRHARDTAPRRAAAPGCPPCA